MNRKVVIRIRLVYLMFFFIGVCIVAQMVRLQSFTNLGQHSEDWAFQEEEIEAIRGNILAKEGRLLASSIPYYQIRIDCVAPHADAFDRNVGDLSKALSQFFRDKTAAAYEKELRAAREAGHRYKLIGNRDVDFKELGEIKKFPLFRLGQFKGGFIAVQKNKRKYPYGGLAFRTIGFINNEGRGPGVESAYDYWLKGQPGRQITQRLPGGERIPVNNSPRVRPLDGFDVQTTIDVDIQEAAESALRSQLAKSPMFEAATAIVMEVKTGAIRAITNLKRGDNGNFEESYNYAIGAATEPGSTFKLATLIALLEGDYLTLNTMVDAGNGKWSYAGKTYSDVTRVGYGKISVLQAFGKSSNVAFAQLAVKHFSGKEQVLLDRLNNMKLREDLNVELLGESPAMIRSLSDKYWSKLSIPSMSIGYEVLLTPMHTLVFYNAVANGGKMMKPYFVESLKRYGQIEKEFRPQVLSGAICSKSTIDSVHKALRYVVTEGTAKAIDDPRYAISGKTGTAQIAFDGTYIDREGYRKHQASFAGFFPSEAPLYSMVVVLYTRKTRDNFYGGSWAAPVFKEIADKIYSSGTDWNNPIPNAMATGYASPPLLAGNDYYTRDVVNMLAGKTPVSTPKAVFNWVSHLPEDDSVPDVTGMGLRDALYLLERKGLKVSVTGMGEVVSQHPEPGTPLSEVKNATITLQKPKIRKTQMAGL